MYLDFNDKLVSPNLESALYHLRPYNKKGWSEKFRVQGAFLGFDFSRVGWVEPSAVLRCVLLSEAALLAGIDVKVRLPNPKPIADELNWLKQAERVGDRHLRLKAGYISKYILRREKAATVLQHLRLEQALRHQHLNDAPGSITIISGFDWSRREVTAAETVVAKAAEVGATPRSAESRGKPIIDPYPGWDEQRPRFPPWYFRVAYGLQWIPDPRTRGRATVNALAEVDILAQVLRHSTGRVAAADERTLAHVFLKELTENTIDHSAREYALAAAWSRPSEISLQDPEVFEEEKPFAAWCKDFPLLEITVGDSGQGIMNTLKQPYLQNPPNLSPTLEQSRADDRILAWAFDKWSSGAANASEKRGTRGLYRVERIVRKYDGCISVRSELSNLVIDCSAEVPKYAPHSQLLPRVPGTVVQVRLPVMLAQDVTKRPTLHARAEASIRVLNANAPNHSFTPQDSSLLCEKVVNLCKTVSATGDDACVIIDLAYASLERYDLEALLRELTEIAHPVALVIANLQSPSWDACIEAIHSISEEVKVTRLRAASTSTSTSTSQTPLTGQVYPDAATAEVQDALYVRDTLLFHHADGRFAWVGVHDQKMRELLDMLWERGKLSGTTLDELIPDSKERNALLRQLSESYHIARREPRGGLSLTFNREDIANHLRLHVEEEVRTALQGAIAPTVRRGSFRTPSLATVSKCIDVYQVLVAVGVDRCLRALAEKLVDRLHIQSRRTLEIVTDSRTNLYLVDCFRKQLRTLLGYRCSIEINQVSPSDVPVITANAMVVVFTDNILTGNVTGQLVTQIARARYKASAVVTVLDSRSRHRSLALDKTLFGATPLSDVEMRRKSKEYVSAEQEAQEQEDEELQDLEHEGDSHTLEYLVGYDLPLISLIKADVLSDGEPEEATIECISPIDGSVEGPLPNDNSDYLLDTVELADMIQSQDALYFEHLSRPNNRHFCFYLDGFRLLGGADTHNPHRLSAAGRSIIQCFIDVILPFANGNEEIRGPVCYPSIEGPAAAHIIAERVASHFNTVCVPVDRVGLNSDWWFASQLQLPSQARFQLNLFDDEVISEPEPPEIVVVTDWGSVTGKSIRELIRLTAALKPQHIVVVVFLSELPLDDERSLRAIDRVRSVDAQGNQTTSQVTVKFIARFPIRYYSDFHCPHCRQLHRLHEEERIFQTDFLRKFVSSARSRLRPRSLIDLQDARQRREALVNSKGTPRLHRKEPLDFESESKNVIDIIKFRGQVERALSSTTERYRLLNDVQVIWAGVKTRQSDALSARNNLVRLLAAEWHWLKQEPLSLSCFKPLIADLAAQLALDPLAASEDRRDAIVVLRTASKARFAHHFTALFKNLVSHEPLIAQLLYCAFTYLQREHLAARTLNALVEELHECTRTIRALPLNHFQTPQARLHVTQTVNDLFVQGMLLSHDKRQSQFTPLLAWRNLRQNWADDYVYEWHHLLAEAIRNLYVGFLEDSFEDHTMPLPDLIWNEIRDCWLKQEHQILKILSSLPMIRGLIEALPTIGILNSSESERLASAMTHGGAMVSTIRTQLDLFSASPDSVRKPGEWKKLKMARDWLFETILNPGEVPQGDKGFERPRSSQARHHQARFEPDASPQPGRSRAGANNGSVLIRALHECPCDVVEAVTHFLKEPHPHGNKLKITMTHDARESSNKAFCHKSVLMSFLREAARNAATHTKPKRYGVPINLVISVRATERRIHIKATNDGRLRNSGSAGEGLKRYGHYLQAYHGKLSLPEPGKKATYVVTVNLPRWT